IPRTNRWRPAPRSRGGFELHMAHIGPFAYGSTQRARVVAGGAVREKIGQVEKPRGASPDAGEVLFEPQELGRFHLGRDGAANVAEHVVPGGVDAIRLIDSAVIHPDDDV